MAWHGRVVAIFACLGGATAPFACGGDAFEVGSGDGGQAVDGAGGMDSMAGDAAVDVDAGTPADGPAMVDGPRSDGVAPAPDGGETVVGTVLDQYLSPMAGLEVHAQGQKATTALDGTFTLAGITTPYILTIVSTPADGHRHGYVFQNVLRKNPTFQLTGDTAGQPQSTTLMGHLSANGTGASGIVFADFAPGTPAASTNAIPIASGASGYSGSLAWFGPPTTATTLYTLQWILTGGAPSSYIAYASQVQSVTANTPLTWNTPVSLTINTQGSLRVTLGTSAGYVPADIGLYVRPGGAQIAAPIEHVTTFAATSSGTFVTPAISGVTFVACGVQMPPWSDGGASSAFGAACTAGLGPDAQPTLALPQSPALLAPASTATLGTVFSYQPMSAAVYLVAFAPAGNTSGDTLYVVTTDTQVKVPDLSTVGFQLPSGTTYAVEVFGFAPFATVDAALSSTGFSSIATDLRLDQGPLASGQIASSGPATFTVQ